MKLADRGLVIIDKRIVATVESFLEDEVTELQFKLSRKQSNDLIIIVENMGRVNYVNHPFKAFDHQRKGILEGSVNLDGKNIEVGTYLKDVPYNLVPLHVPGGYLNFTPIRGGSLIIHVCGLSSESTKKILARFCLDLAPNLSVYFEGVASAYVRYEGGFYWNDFCGCKQVGAFIRCQFPYRRTGVLSCPSGFYGSELSGI